jgi:2-dehydro-3-deoxyglucarate aldolase/4-hydroxy-2-oxoheptanedioate aldolase
METQAGFRAKLQAGQVCLGTCITFADPTVTEALCDLLDFVWIDTEHNPLTLEAVQGHVLATKGTATTPLVRVPWNDPVLIKPVLDLGAAGVIVPLIRTAEDARRAVAACKYPPEGVRGFGPRRPSRYGRAGGPEYIRSANESVLVVVQIEHADAVANIDDILAVPGLTSVVVGPNDLSGSLGHMGEPGHPDVRRAIERVIARANQARVPVGLAAGGEPEVLAGWLDQGVQWLACGADFLWLVRAATQFTDALRGRARKGNHG